MCNVNIAQVIRPSNWSHKKMNEVVKEHGEYKTYHVYCIQVSIATEH